LKYNQLDLVRHRLSAGRIFCWNQVQHSASNAEINRGYATDRMDELIRLVNDLTSAGALIESLESAYIPVDQTP
jgi:hypothetical protein